jgi:hypothetical protein
MYTQDLARERIHDMLRDADAFRRSRETRTARSAGRRTAIRRMATAAVSGLLWPVKH